MLTVRRVEGRADLRRALELPYELHAQDPAWVPPLRVLVRHRTRRFLKDEVLALFVAERDGKVVGTISALRDRDFEKARGERVAWWGYFETVDDPEVVAALFECATQVARGWGATHLRGPRDLTRMENVGLTVEGHDKLPPFLQGHHPPYYQRLVEGAGLTKHHDVLAYDISVLDEQGRIKEIPEAIRQKAAAVQIPGLVVRSASRRTLGQDLLAAHTVLNESYQTVPDVAPMPRAAFVSLGRTYLAFADPNLLQIATADGRPVGFAACLPEINEAIVAARGRLLPFGWARIARALRHVRTASFKLIGVVPELRGTGLHAVMIQAIVEGVRTAGYHRVDGSVIDERNGPMRAVVEHIGMEIYRRYRFYERAL
jgi:GNAT superfamily N-acetyltransferase